MCTLPITGGGIMDYKANIPIYLQVIDDIKKRILTGEIKLGDKLPSTRELAVQYTVNPNTAARIYNELEQCGLCYTKRGLGTFVSEDVHLIDTLKAELSSEMIETFISGMTSLGFSKDEIINLIKNVTKKYMKMTAVNGVSIDFMPGRIYALLGSNGSGKTTLMKMIAGLVKPTSGDITLSGVPIGVETKKHIAYMPTESYFYNYMSCADIGKYYADFFEDFSLDQYYNYLNEMKLTPDMKASKMSSGMMAKLKLAVNLSRNASVIMLDEPLNGVDIVAREQVINAVISKASPDKIIIMSSHLVDELEAVIDYAVFIKDGVIVSQGDAENLRTASGMSIVDQYKRIYAY